jgi:hypothetical protein
VKLESLLVTSINDLPVATVSLELTAHRSPLNSSLKLLISPSSHHITFTVVVRRARRHEDVNDVNKMIA